MAEVLLGGPSSPLPPGQSFFTARGVWTVDADLRSLTHSTGRSPTRFDLKELDLTASDTIHFIDFIEQDRFIFIHATRSAVPTGFLISLAPVKPPVPQVRSFALNTVMFHRTIQAACVLCETSICIISGEGISLHTVGLKHICHFICPVMRCCYCASAVAVVRADPCCVVIHRFDSDRGRISPARTIVCWLGSAMMLKQIIVLSHTLVVISESSPYVLKFSLIEQNADWIELSGIIPCPSSFNAAQFAVYDDALVVFDRKGKYCRLYDLFGDREVIIGGSAGGVFNSLIGIYDSSIAVSCSSMADLRPNYEGISDATAPVIAALFRRSRGLFAATALFIKQFTAIPTVSDLKSLIQAIAPSARSATAQLRLTRAIQFSAVVNPHFLLLALLEYAHVLGPEMIPLAKIPLMELLFHPACRHSLGWCRLGCDVRLPIDILTVVIRAGLPVDWRCAGGLLDYAEVCIGAGRTAEARAVLLKARLDGEEDGERMKRLDSALTDCALTIGDTRFNGVRPDPLPSLSV
jgi:hypothetical protein